MKVKEVSVGDLVELRTKEKTWKGIILESHDSEVVLLKLSSGYNIGIRENTVLDIKVEEKAKEIDKKEVKLKAKKDLPNVALIITGGTISSRLDPKTGGVISTDAEEILNITPELKEICNIVKIEKPFMKWSENMSFIDWKKLAEATEKLLNDDEISGVVITHGTDFLHYTSAALSFFLKDLNKPVALTYSQRSIDRGSTDAALNLLCATKYAISDVAEVAVVGHKNLNDEVCLVIQGTKVRKMHTSRRDTFRVVNDYPIVEISENKFEIMKDFRARDNSKKVKLDVQYSDKIAVVKFFPGQDVSILEHYKEKGYKGIIIEASGIGQVAGKQASGTNWLPTIKKLIKSGIAICVVPQTIFGELNLNVYENGRELENTGVINLRDMLSETAFVKLGWVLGHKTISGKPEKIKEKMLENVSGEFNDRLGLEN